MPAAHAPEIQEAEVAEMNDVFWETARNAAPAGEAGVIVLDRLLPVAAHAREAEADGTVTDPVIVCCAYQLLPKTSV